MTESPIDIVPYTHHQAPYLQGLWQAATAARHPITPALWEAVTTGDPGFWEPDLLVAVVAGEPVGFVLTKHFTEMAIGCVHYHAIGWISLLAVHPAHQRQGVGRRLVAAAEAALAKRDLVRVRVGGSFHHVMPGLPDHLPEAIPFFEALGYDLGEAVWDVRRNLREGEPIQAPSPEAGMTYRTCRPGEEGQLLQFLEREFAGRWSRDTAHWLVNGGDVSRVMGAFAEDGLAGFAQLHPPGSEGALRWAGFSPAVAALGPIGLAEAQRGHGRGLALLQASLAALMAYGATDTVIDWTTLLDFYGKVGFKPWLRYVPAEKRLA